jgi:AcrR family transcriptional regulator
VLAAAERLLVAAGTEDEVSIRAVAAAVGVSPAAIYLHFPDKDALMAAVCTRVFVVFDAALEAAGAAATDPIDDLHRRGRAYVEFGLANPGQYEIIFLTKKDSDRWARTPEHERPGAQAYFHLVAAVQRAMDAGAIRDDDAELVATGLWLCVHGITSLLMTLPDFRWPDRDVLIDHVLQAHLRGLAAADPAPAAHPPSGRPSRRRAR